MYLATCNICKQKFNPDRANMIKGLYVCKYCRNELVDNCTVYDRDEGIGKIPKNLKEQYGNNI